MCAYTAKNGQQNNCVLQVDQVIFALIKRGGKGVTYALIKRRGKGIKGRGSETREKRRIEERKQCCNHITHDMAQKYSFNN